MPKHKAIAPAKYYFIMKMAELGTDDDRFKHGIQITKTFMKDLEGACFDFKIDWNEENSGESVDNSSSISDCEDEKLPTHGYVRTGSTRRLGVGVRVEIRAVAQEQDQIMG